MKKRPSPVTCRYLGRVLSFVVSALRAGVRLGSVGLLPAGGRIDSLGVLFMKPTLNPTCAFILAAAVSGVVCPAIGYGQAAAAATSVVGTVTKIDAAAKSMTLKTDAGQEYTVSMEGKVTIRKIAAGETDVSKAAVIQVGDIAVNDRVQAKGKAEDKNIAAATIFVMSRSDVTKTQDAQRADWDKRGVSGPVTAVSADSVTITVRSLTGAKPMVIALAPNAVVRRYAPDSVNFADAKVSALPEIKVGDEVRARGDKAADGSKMTAEEIVAGTFKTIAGVVLSINAASGEMQVRDVDTKKPVTVRINKDSTLKKVQPQFAQVIANQLHPADAADGAAKGGGRGGRGGGRGGEIRGGADVAQMLDNSPAITLADLKAGDAIVVSSTVGAVADKITAIKLYAGVEPILTKPGTQEMSLGGWSLGSGGGGAD
jgi:hypothetical protein